MGRQAVQANKTRLSIESVAGQTLYRKVYRAILDGILSGALASGTRLPSTRLLASQLKISRNSVSHAYDQLLSEGYLESRVGSGTYVADRLPDGAPRRRRLYARQSAKQKVARLIAVADFPAEEVGLQDSEENSIYIFSTSIN
jgi:GntR family transcriptional regulator/MocR family aminotransferase